MAKEKYKPITGFNGRYEVSDLGNVRSVARFTRNGKDWRDAVILKSRSYSTGYRQLTLRDNDDKRYSRTVHKLVAVEFVDGYFYGAVVNHIDGNKLNNSSTNLEWITQKENIAHSIKLGLRAKKYKLNTIGGHSYRKI